ncbi:MAG TPA: NAD(P)-dependent oxidoreductase, partial [Methylomirabilota bacterium]|nr:NAD(P)-dependent oxidoreductase [Methylomirabilota bacterium]
MGLGLMGRGMAANLARKGFPLTVVAHRSRAAVDALVGIGAREAPSLAALASASDLVFICVTGTPEVEAVVYGSRGLLEAARPGLVVVDCSTSEPASTARIAADLAARGARFADAPLARTPKDAEAGRLNVMVGADPETFAAVRPALEAFAENIVHVGPIGDGHKAKLVYNFMSMGIAALAAEMLATAAKVGLDLRRLHALVSAGGANSGIWQLIVPKALEGDFTGLGFGLANARKDLRYYTHLAEAAGIPA